MDNPFTLNKVTNPYGQISKPLISKHNGSPLLGNGTINSVKPSLRIPGGTTKPINQIQQSQQQVGLVRPWPVNTPQPLVSTMNQPVRESLRSIFNDTYYKQLFEYSAPAATPLAPIVGVAPIQKEIRHGKAPHIYIHNHHMAGQRSVRATTSNVREKTPFHPGTHTTQYRLANF